jgi:quercetin 2,3-dioxygenase
MKPSGHEKSVMVKRPSEARGETHNGSIHGRHTFSFGDYFDPDHMGFRALRVLNEKTLAPGASLEMQEHQDLEIVTYVIEGCFEHKDSLGNGSVVRAGASHYVSAGGGIGHRESNPSHGQPLHFLQAWLTPNTSGGEPRVAEKARGNDARKSSLVLLFGGQPRKGALATRLDAEIYVGRIEKGSPLAVRLAPTRHAWIQVINGRIRALGHKLQTGDGAAISLTTNLEIVGEEDSQFLLFNLA